MTCDVDRVLVVAKTHLDVGFTGTGAAVREMYLTRYFPAAMRTAQELRDRGGDARLRWTTGSWILTEALEAADPAHRRRLDAAIEAGDLCWHALPFTLHTEYCDRSLLEHGLSLSAELDRRYGRVTRAAKMTDVPGHTRALVSVLADAGVDLLHIGVNPAAAAPRVPDRFRWRDPAAAGAEGDGGRDAAPEISVMYQPGGYGAVQVVEGTRTAVAVLLTGDNLGPPRAEDVVATFEELAQRFPGAEVRAATLDDVAAVMAGASSSLPVVDGEIGDSWIHGVASDPVKTAGFRALCRERVRWIEEGRVEPADPTLSRASTRLLLVAEHTWGMDLKAHWPDTAHWGRAELAEARRERGARLFEASWGEQRGYLEEYVSILRSGGRDDLADRAVRVLRESAPREVSPRHLARGAAPAVRSEPGAPVRVGGFEVTVDPVDGSIVGLVAPDGRDWASPLSRLARFEVQTFDARDYERWYATYNASVLPEDDGWARWDNTKPGLDGTSARSATWGVSVAETRLEADGLVVDLELAAGDADPIAVPASLRCVIGAAVPGTSGRDRHPCELRIALEWTGLPAVRWPVVWWWSFAPLVGDPSSWQMEKLGERVSPGEVVPGGGLLHAADRLVHPDGIEIELVDTPVVSVGGRHALRWGDTRVDMADGWHVALYANLWGTNFPMWIEGDGRLAVVLRTT